MSYLSIRAFWAGTAERAVKTFAQATIAALTAAQAVGAIGVDVTAVNWHTALCVATGATILSLLTSIASGPLGPTNTPSLTRSEPD